MSKSESRRYQTHVRLAEDVIDDARVVVRLRNVDMAAYLTEILRPVVGRDLAASLRDRLASTAAGSTGDV